jgi:hypothetical protein
MAVSPLHEGVLELVRKQPDFVPALLTKLLDIGVSSRAEVRRTDSVFNEARAIEYRADAAFLMHVEDIPVLGAIVEAQLQKDDDKRYTWPLYATSARALHRCPVVVMVLAPDPVVARWAGQPIDLGHGSVFQPQVIGPQQIPRITDAEEAMRDLQMAALSVVAHGKGDPEMAARIALALAKAVAVLPRAEAWLYLSLIDHGLSQAAKEALRMMPEAPKYLSESLRRTWDRAVSEGKLEGKIEGKIEGQAEGIARSLLAILAQRGFALSDDQRRHIADCTDLAVLDQWLGRVLSVTSVDELLAARS